MSASNGIEAGQGFPAQGPGSAGEAAALLRDLARKSSVRFFRLGVERSSEEILHYPEVVSCLLKIGLFSLNISSMARMGAPDEGDPPLLRLPVMPAAILGLGFDYALEAAPRVEGLDNVIDVSRMIRHVRNIEAWFGSIDLDSELVFGLQADPVDLLPVNGAGAGA